MKIEKIIILELKTLNDGRQKEKISKRYRKSNLETTNTIERYFLFLLILLLFDNEYCNIHIYI